MKSPRAETQFPTPFPLLAPLSQVCLLFPTSMPMFMPFLLPEITFLLSPKALIQFLEASGPSWHGLQSKSGGEIFQRPPPTIHLLTYFLLQSSPQDPTCWRSQAGWLQPHQASWLSWGIIHAFLGASVP